MANKPTVAELSETVNLQSEIISDLSEKIAALEAANKPAARPVRKPRHEVLRAAPEELRQRSKQLYESLKALSDVYEQCEHVQTSLMEPTSSHPNWGYVIWNGPMNGQGRTTYQFADWDRVQDWLNKKVAAAEATRRRADPSRATIAEIASASA
jgi:hypothetical protein